VAYAKLLIALVKRQLCVQNILLIMQWLQLSSFFVITAMELDSALFVINRKAYVQHQKVISLKPRTIKQLHPVLYANFGGWLIF